MSSSFLGPVHTTLFLLVSLFVAFIEATVHTAPFLYKTVRKTSVFVRSHCSVFVKPVIGCWSVFKNFRFCAFKLIKCIFKNLLFLCISTFDSVFENLRFCGVLCRSVCTLSQKRRFFSPLMVQCEQSPNLSKVWAEYKRTESSKAPSPPVVGFAAILIIFSKVNWLGIKNRFFTDFIRHTQIFNSANK